MTFTIYLIHNYLYTYSTRVSNTNNFDVGPDPKYQRVDPTFWTTANYYKVSTVIKNHEILHI